MRSKEIGKVSNGGHMTEQITGFSFAAIARISAVVVRGHADLSR
jgi:hypothetical protein